jgi:hypothetical protein
MVFDTIATRRPGARCVFGHGNPPGEDRDHAQHATHIIWLVCVHTHISVFEFGVAVLPTMFGDGRGVVSATVDQKKPTALGSKPIHCIRDDGFH